jgi:O-antigen ligase
MLFLLSTEKLNKLPLRWLVLISFVPLGTVRVLTVNSRAPKLAALVSSAVAMPLTLRGRPSVWPASRLFTLATILIGGLMAAAVILEPGALYKRSRLERFDGMMSEEHGTSYWRRIWWSNINNAVLARNPLVGLGFGESLGIYNPHLAGDEHSEWPVRSPHNFNVTVYGRMGILGSALWLLILLIGIGGLALVVARRKNYHGHLTQERAKELTFWLVALIATFTNGSVGLLMEGPVLGIPFWFALGFAHGRAKDRTGTQAAQGAPS